jgi:hypothetical protein
LQHIQCRYFNVRNSCSAEETRLEKAQVSRIRETLIKIGVKVTVSGRRILVELANYCAFKEEIKIIVQRLLTGGQLIFCS